jgi:hypothetical protein
MSNTEKSNDFELNEQVDEETKTNKKKLRCIRCNSLILQEMTSVFKQCEQSIPIPSMKPKKDLANPSNIETIDSNMFWLVDDMMKFDNVGFTNLVDKKKYLICADCEIGPIGLQPNADVTNEFLVCVDRVKYVL